MIYWGLEGAHLEYCCQRRLDDRMSDTYTFYTAEEPGTLGRDEARSGGAEAAPSRRWLERMRRTFEEPTSSLAAQILASVSVVFVIVSMVVLCASTLPDWRAAAADNRSLDDRSRIIEAICIGWFTAECIVRFIVSKNKCEFVKRPLNIIDLLAITPYYISVLMTTLGLTLKRCYREMVMLLVFICVAMAIFSALSQLLEHGLDLETSNKDFASIPAACWVGITPSSVASLYLSSTFSTCWLPLIESLLFPLFKFQRGIGLALSPPRVEEWFSELRENSIFEVGCCCVQGSFHEKEMLDVP
ncbi:potassium voltage-gated channel, subfamily G, member 3 isoform 2 [Camelus ferus]|nr:potassium voltage-gated channel, subfamily G, member 3 isoform 2 [Camelus ferus]